MTNFPSYYTDPAPREHYIRCGQCKAGHATVDAVKACYDWARSNTPDIEDEDGSQAYARMLERRAEQGSWFGFGG